MQPSSLVFVVIVGIWAAFFVQYWVRRREHIATARSVDAFTETMRVLQVRDPSPSVEMTDRPRSYAVSPARPARPAVTVKRAGVGGDQGLPGHRLDHSDGVERDGFEHEGREDFDGQWRRGGLLGALDSLRFAVQAVRHAPRAPRGLTFLVGLLGTVVFGVLSLLGVLIPWAALVPLGMALFGFVWLRADVRAADRARRQEREAAGPPARREVGTASSRSTQAMAPLTPMASSEPTSTSHDTREAPPANHDTHEAPPASPEVDPRDLVFDVSAGLAAPETTGATVASAPRGGRRPLLDEDDMPLTWDPVPVPKPTYTMKAKATRVSVTPEAPVVPTQGRPSARAAADLTAGDWDDDVPEFFPAARRATG